MAEERRLFYVGLTRAMNQIYLVTALNRASYGYTEPAEPSRFLRDIDETLLIDHRGRSRKSRSRNRSKKLGWDDFEDAAPAGPQYSAGMRVRHNTWGEGMVLNSRMQDGDETVDIFFESVGLKRVAASLAKLETITD